MRDSVFFLIGISRSSVNSRGEYASSISLQKKKNKIDYRLSQKQLFPKDLTMHFEKFLHKDIHKKCGDQ